MFVLEEEGFFLFGLPVWSDKFLSPFTVCIPSPILLHVDSGLEIRWLPFVISGLGDLQHGWGCRCPFLLVFLSVRVLLVWVSTVWWVPGAVRPFSFCFSVLLCAKWLLLACAVHLFLLFFLCFRRPRQRALSPLSFLLALVAVGPSWSVVVAVCLC